MTGVLGGGGQCKERASVRALRPAGRVHLEIRGRRRVADSVTGREVGGQDAEERGHERRRKCLWGR